MSTPDFTNAQAALHDDKHLRSRAVTAVLYV